MKEKMKEKGKMNVKVKQKATNSDEKEGNEHERQDNWKKKSIFFELVYWDFLPIRHDLDVIHIETNVCDNVLFTLLGIAGKTKDHLNARLNLKELNIKPSLHPQETSSSRILLPPACFTLGKDEKYQFLKLLKDLKVPDGYGSNISRCVHLKELSMWGLKSHDNHIILQQLLPLVVRRLLPKHVVAALIELSNFFRILCSKVNSKYDLQKIQDRISLTLCHLEKIFPPSFFDIMEHLPIHLAEEALLAGPVQYQWMYPIERYLKDIETKSTRPDRNYSGIKTSCRKKVLTTEVIDMEIGFIMATRKRRRTYTFTSEMPRSTQENNDNQEVDTNVSDQDHVQTLVQTATEDNQDTHATSTPLEDSSQDLTHNNTIDASVQTSLASSGSGSSTSNDVHKKGRGPALGYQGKEKIKIIFNECMQAIGDSSTDLENLLGGIAKCEARAPLILFHESQCQISWKLTKHTLRWHDDVVAGGLGAAVEVVRQGDVDDGDDVGGVGMVAMVMWLLMKGGGRWPESSQSGARKDGEGKESYQGDFQLLIYNMKNFVSIRNTYCLLVKTITAWLSINQSIQIMTSRLPSPMGIKAMLKGVSKGLRCNLIAWYRLLLALIASLIEYLVSRDGGNGDVVGDEGWRQVAGIRPERRRKRWRRKVCVVEARVINEKP
nr:hypothetical protein [Tanacetum cinerariifolium]